MQLYFIRHGKTEWNEEGRLQGAFGDSPLLLESYLQLRDLSKHLKDIPFKKIYASPALRTRKTAQGIYAHLEHPCGIQMEEGLREFGMGELEGVHFDEANERFPQQMYAFRTDLSQYHPEVYGGEPIEKILERAKGVVEKAIDENEEGPILFVSHGATLTALIRHLAGYPLDELRSGGGLDNNSINIMETHGKNAPFELITWNDVDYLRR